jgi:hypothetical protein
MSTDPNTNGGLGCGGAIIIIVALFILMGLAGLGSDTSSWDCPGEQTPCQEEK